MENLNQNFRLSNNQLPKSTDINWSQVSWRIEGVKPSTLKAEQYLDNFAEFCVQYAINSGYGKADELGAGIKVHISDTIGKKRVSNRNGGSHAIGYCYPKSWSEGNERVIEVDRTLDNTLNVLNVVAHEVSHAVLPEGLGHNGAFVKLVKDVFKLGGKPTATVETPEFLLLVANWINNNGLYPHVSYTDKGAKQTTRLIKLACLNIACAGGTDKSRKQGQGTIFRLSSGVVIANSTIKKDKEGNVVQKDVSTYDSDGEIVEYKYIDYWNTKITCPVCQGKVSVESQIPYDEETGTSILYQ